MKAAVDMLKKEQAKVIKAFEKVLDATEIKQGKEVKAVQRGEVMNAKNTVAKSTSKRYNKNTEQYRVMWTIEEGVLSNQDISIFYDLIGDKKRGLYFPKSFEGETIFEIDNKLVYADTDYHYPSISKVITIHNLDTPELKQCIEVIIDGEGIGIESAENYSFAEIVYGEGTVSSADFVDSKAYRREKDGRRKRDGSGTFDSRSGKNVLKSKPETDTESEIAKASISIPPVLNLDAEVQAKLNELVEKYGKINKSPDVNIPKAVSDEIAVRKHEATEIESEIRTGDTMKS